MEVTSQFQDLTTFTLEGEWETGMVIKQNISQLQHCHLLRKGRKEIVATLTNSVDPKYNSVMGVCC
jgi:hypothetical protein